MSAPPPGAKPTVNLTGLSGNGPAKADGKAPIRSDPAVHRAVRRVRFKLLSPGAAEVRRGSLWAAQHFAKSTECYIQTTGISWSQRDGHPLSAELRDRDRLRLVCR